MLSITGNRFRAPWDWVNNQIFLSRDLSRKEMRHNVISKVLCTSGDSYLVSLPVCVDGCLPRHLGTDHSVFVEEVGNGRKEGAKTIF